MKAAPFAVLLLLLSSGTSARTEEIARWKLAGNARDASGNGLHAEVRDVTFDVPGPKGRPGTAARFNGTSSVLTVPHTEKLDFGTGDFSIGLWLHTVQNTDDVPGDLISRYDPETRNGFQLSLDSRPGVTASQSNWRNLHFGIDNAKSEEKWTDHGRLGEAILIYGMAVHDGQLFAGTCVAGADQAGRVFRFDGQKWTDCGAPDRCNAVSSLAVYENQLYVGVSKYRLSGSSLAESQNPALGGKVYRYKGDNDWEHCGTLPDVEAINGMVVYRNELYASSMYAPAGFFRYEGGTRWVSLFTPDQKDKKRVESLTVHDGYIYASGYDEGAVYRFDGTSWEHQGVIPEATQTYGFATHRGDLYVSEWPHARVMRFGGRPGQWLPAGRLGEEKETMPLVVYNGKMYGGTLPTAEVYRFDGGTEWTRFGRLDQTPDVRYRRVWSMAVFQGRLFAGVLPSGHVHSIEVGRNVTYDHVLQPGWRHITAVRRGERLELYVDGRQVSQSKTFSPQDYDLKNTRPLQIGFGANDHFNGRLSDVRIFSHALTAGEIAALAKGE